MKSQGYALVLVMIFLLIFSIIIQSAVEASLLTAYSSRNFSEFTNLFYTAENALREVEEKLQHHGREEQGTLPVPGSKITYAIHDLGSDPCATLLIPETIAHYYEIKILAEAESGEGHIALRTTEILPAPAKEAEICLHVPRVIHSGRQSWHQWGG